MTSLVVLSASSLLALCAFISVGSLQLQQTAFPNNHGKLISV
jgi:hypothetical protein